MPVPKKPKIRDYITSVEWMLVIIGMVIIDIVQYFLTPLIVANRIIDVGVGFLLVVYCFLRGLTTIKQIVSIIGAFGLEFMGPGDVLPLWTADIIVIMIWHKAELKLEQRVPGASGALKTRYMRRVARKLPFVQPKITQPDLPGLNLPKPKPPISPSRNTLDLRNTPSQTPTTPSTPKKSPEQLDLL